MARSHGFAFVALLSTIAASGCAAGRTFTTVSASCNARWGAAECRALQLDLLTASRRGDLPTARAALQAGARAGASGRIGSTPLMDAIVEGHTEIVDLLLQHGAPLDDVNEVGTTSLILALMYSHDAARRLIDAGADLGPRDKQTDIPLVAAARLGLTDFVMLIRSAWAGAFEPPISASPTSSHETPATGRLRRSWRGKASCRGRTASP
jgi:hypothetical protein